MAAFNEFEDQYILVLQPDEVAHAEELAYVDTVLDPAAAAIETAEVTWKLRTQILPMLLQLMM